jgi:tetratricopeptide (TPR) repeat protein
MKGKASAQKSKPVAPMFSAWLNLACDVRKSSLLLLIFTCVLYGNTLWHEYTQDDAIVITDNMFTTQGIKGIPGLFKYDTFYGFFKEEGKAALVAGGRYRPLTPAMFAVELAIFGQNPFWGHLFNLLWYALCGILLYLLVYRLLEPIQGQISAGVALLLAMLFLAHPVHTEAVANIKGRDEIMALLFSLFSLYAIVRHSDHGGIKWLIAAGLSFFLGLLAKENTITFLAIIPLALWVFRNKALGTTLKPLLPLVGVTLLFLIIRTAVIGQFLGAEPPKELMNNPFLKLENGIYIPFSSAEKTATILFTLGKYLQLMLFPHPLTHDYYPRQVEIMQWSNIAVLFSFFVYLFLFLWSIRSLIKSKSMYGFGVLFYLICLSIVSNIVFPVGTNLSERFLFMPSIGLLLIPALWMHKEILAKGKTMLFGTLIVSILLLYSIKTIDRNAVWESNARLFLTDVKTSVRSAKIQNAAGGEKIRLSQLESNDSKKQQLLTEAVEHLNKAIEIHPTYKNAWLLMGNALFYLEKYPESVQSYEKALALDPNYKDALVNIGVAYRQGGKQFGEVQNNIPKALEYLQQAERYLPEDYETNRLLGIAYAFNNSPQNAIKYFLKAAELQPEIADAWRNLGNAYAQSGDLNQANFYLEKAEKLKQSEKGQE